MSPAPSTSHDSNTLGGRFQRPPQTLAELLAGFNNASEPPGDSTNPCARGLYIHIPFCFHKCHYCDFYSIVDDRDRQAAFTERMIDEIRTTAPLNPGPLQTIFVGGGTPTLLRPDLWQRLLHAIRENYRLADNLEFTVEANPETVTADLLRTLAGGGQIGGGGGGVNRISIGAQSFNAAHLHTLERHHDPANVARAVALARDAGIDDINLDLIFAIPGQSLADWQADLDAALALQPTHLSCYALMYEPNTPLTRKMQRGRITRAEEDTEAAMYAHTIERLTGEPLSPQAARLSPAKPAGITPPTPHPPGATTHHHPNPSPPPGERQGEGAGFEHYEISNFARPGRRCRHNLLYWMSENTLAIGPSASGHIAGVRWKNATHLGRYLATTAGHTPIEQVEHLAPDASLGEQLMLRIRLRDGIAHPWLDRHADPARLATIDRLINQGLLERTPTHTRLTPHGLMLADTVCAELL